MTHRHAANTEPRRSSAIVGLRLVRPEDVDRILAWRAESSTCRHQPIRQLQSDELRALLADRGRTPLTPDAESELQWVIETGDGPVGWVRLAITGREHGVGDIGYTVGERFRGRGYATAAIRDHARYGLLRSDTGFGEAPDRGAGRI